jgi:hypothetical protein
VLNTDASATITLNAEAATSAGAGFAGPLGNLLCGLLAVLEVCKQESISVPIGFLADHPILDRSTGSIYSWFTRNKWNEVTYYVAAPGVLPSSGTRACTTNSTCLNVTYHPNNGKQQRARTPH